MAHNNHWHFLFLQVLLQPLYSIKIQATRKEDVSKGLLHVLKYLNMTMPLASHQSVHLL